MTSREILNEVVRLGQDGPEFDYTVPREKGALSTHIHRSDDEGRWADRGQGIKWSGNPALYVRHRKIPGSDKMMTQFVIYSKDQASTSLMRALKQASGPEMEQFVRRSATYTVAALKGHGIDVVASMPSSSPLSLNLAKEIASRLGVPVVQPLTKQKSVVSMGVSQRAKNTFNNFDVTDKPLLNGRVLVVDDFITTGSSLTGAAANLYLLPDVTDVIGLAITSH